MSEEDCGYHPPSAIRTGCKCDRCEAVRAKVNARKRERYANDPEYRAARHASSAARKRERYANDPDWRAEQIASSAARKRERYANDPEYRAEQIASAAASKRAKRQALCDKVNAIQLTQEDVMSVIWAGLS